MVLLLTCVPTRPIGTSRRRTRDETSSSRKRGLLPLVVQENSINLPPGQYPQPVRQPTEVRRGVQIRASCLSHLLSVFADGEESRHVCDVILEPQNDMELSQ